ncbi:MAG: amidohydrolase family protein, partial [Candidatus Bipolaricaulaceae bacterium]
MSELVLVGGTVVTPRGIGPACVRIRDGRIVAVRKSVGRAARRESAAGLFILPGVVDAHVHFALPVAGTRSADDFLSGSRAAAAGGVTTFVDFTLGRPDVPLPAAVEARLAEARPSVVDYSLHVEMVGWTADRAEEIRACAELGLRSFKFYLAYSESG